MLSTKLIWRRGWDSNPRPLAESLVFKTSSLNHSDTSPYFLVYYFSAINFYILHYFFSFVNTFFTIFSSFSKFYNSKMLTAQLLYFIFISLSSIFYTFFYFFLSAIFHMLHFHLLQHYYTLPNLY